jgi:thymidine phosphorylase
MRTEVAYPAWSRPLRPSAAAFHAVDLIRTKRDGGELSDDQIDWLIAAYTADEIADEQMSALAMAVWFRGLSKT